MGGGKSQKGGRHGFIGRTLAHDILARQTRLGEALRGERPHRPNEQSVFERNSLDEFTLAAEQGLETYLSAHGTTKEVIASDFNSQLARMINYSEVKELKVFPVVPIPRRCIFFEDRHREIIGKLIKQREHEQHLREKKKNKRRNKKLVDMYMQGSGPRPVNGMFEPRKHMAMAKHSDDGLDEDELDGDSDTLSDLDDDGGSSASREADSAGSGSEHSDPQDDPEESCASYASEEESEDEDGSGTQEIDHTDAEATSDATIDDEDEDGSDSEYDDSGEDSDDSGVVDAGNCRNDAKGHTDNQAFHVDPDDDSGFETEGIVGVFPTVVPKSQKKGGGKGVPKHQRKQQVPQDNPTGPANASAAPGGRTDGAVKYVKEYRKAIEEEVAGVDICKIDAAELGRIEMKCFYAWRKLLSTIEAEEGRVITPYEKNIEYWRQLWRVIERSHVLLIIVDARDPLFYRVPDLESYVKEVDKRKETILILNKSDYLSLELRKEWANYFEEKGVDFLFFSTIWTKMNRDDLGTEQTETDKRCMVYNVEMLLRKINEYRKKHRALFPELREADNPDNPRYTVGFVGYPNVGKSSLINCLMEATKTTVSCQPGKTKHFQTLALKKANITLCDCPGLIFPNIVATKHHLLVNSIVSTAHFRGSLIFAVQLICNRIPKQLCERYDVDMAECVVAGKGKKEILFSQKFLECICCSRKFYAGGKGGQPDIGRAAKLVMKDYVNGDLLYCARPPNSKHIGADHYGEEGAEAELAESLAKVKLGEMEDVEQKLKVPREVELAEARMQQWLMSTSEDIPAVKEKPMTKRKMRFLIKGKRKVNNKKTVDPYA